MITEITKVYDLLVDEESKEIFKNRLLWNVTRENKYADAMFSYQLKRLKEDAQVKKLIVRVRRLLQNKEIIVYGIGFYGRKILWMLEEFLPEYKILGVYDQKLKGGEYRGYEVLSIETLIEKKNHSVILVSPRYKEKEIEAFLLSNNVRNCIFVHRDDDMKAFTKLDSYNQYYDKVVRFNEDEVFVDAGVLDAETSIEFSQKCPNYNRIYAFEPDEKNYERCSRIGKEIERFKVLNYGLWNQQATLCFSSGNGSSCISDTGECKIEVDSLDNILDEERVTFIKMDIEGAEYNALKGAEKCIKRWSPKLAICIYHESDDLIRIPLLINEFDKDYKFYIRHYSISSTETVLYAIKE